MLGCEPISFNYLSQLLPGIWPRLPMATTRVGGAECLALPTLVVVMANGERRKDFLFA